MKELTLGSLFDGIAGFPLAASRHGIVTKWTSEIEPFPVKVSANHFPDAVQLGDVTKISGADIEPVDIISFGSPCQSVSVAGKRKGLKVTCKSCGYVFEGEVTFICSKCGGETDVAASALFFEAIRVIEEMLQATNWEYPKILVFENVPGLLSSEKGKDFMTVLDNIQDLRFIPDPNILDAQYMGVPQRRKRVFIPCLNAKYLLKQRTNLSWTTLTKWLTEILLLILGELCIQSNIEPDILGLTKQQVDGGLQKRMKLFGIEEISQFMKLLNNWDEMSALYTNELNNSESANEIVNPPNEWNQITLFSEVETESLSIGQSWRNTLDVVLNPERLSTMLTQMNEITNLITSISVTMRFISERITNSKELSLNLSEAALSLLTAMKGAMNYARQCYSKKTKGVEWLCYLGDNFAKLPNCIKQLEQYSSRQCTPQILSQYKGLPGDFEQGRTAREEVAASVGDGTKTTSRINCEPGGDFRNRQ